MSFDHTIRSGDRELRCGYTTGTCAALAAAGATWLLLTGHAPTELSLQTPKGWAVSVAPAECVLQEDRAVCSVVKDAGDDPDITNGMTVTATVCKFENPGIVIDGGEGVGHVTRPGLDQPVGAAAINRVPRQMIRQEVESVCAEAEYEGGLRVVISIPNGQKIAAKTFNPILGVEGGLSILGTSGIVEPMSEQALVDTLRVQIRQLAAEGARQLILTPGNYGQDFIRSSGLDQLGIPVLKISNFIGDALDFCAEYGILQLLLVGHLGKLVKVAAGARNTHSKYGDHRMTTLADHAARCGASDSVRQQLLNAATTEAALELLENQALRDPVLQSLGSAIQDQLNIWLPDTVTAGVLVFSNTCGELFRSPAADRLLAQWRRS